MTEKKTDSHIAQLVDRRYGPTFFNRLLGVLVVCAFGYTLALGYTIGRDGLERRVQKKLLAEIDAATYWAAGDKSVYFISGPELLRIGLDSRGLVSLYKSDSPIIEYHFSPDGRSILVVSEGALDFIAANGADRERVESFAHEDPDQGIKHAISGIHWSKDSRRFVYNLSRWSSFSSQDYFLIYDVVAKQKSQVKSPPHQIPELTWDEKGENLYYARSEGHLTYDGTVYTVVIYRVALASLKPEKLASLTEQKERELAKIDLKPWKVRLFLSPQRLDFTKSGLKSQSAQNPDGRKVDVDREGWVSVREASGKSRRIVRLPGCTYREPFPIGLVEWAPGGRYVLITHAKLGLLLFDPVTAKVGQILNVPSGAFGWSPDEG